MIVKSFHSMVIFMSNLKNIYLKKTSRSILKKYLNKNNHEIGRIKSVEETIHENKDQ